MVTITKIHIIFYKKKHYLAPFLLLTDPLVYGGEYQEVDNESITQLDDLEPIHQNEIENNGQNTPLI